MSQNDPEVLRAEIARTRAELSDNVDTLTETANPKSIAHRQAGKVKGAARGVREHLMGTPDDPTDTGSIGERAAAVKDRATGTVGSVQDGGSGALDAVTDAPRQVQRRTRGNPLAAGLIAFGAGMLFSSLIPASEKEREAADALKTKAEPLTTELTEAAKEVAEGLKAPAQEAMENVKATAAQATDHVKAEGQGAVDDVKYRAADAKDNVQQV